MKNILWTPQHVPTTEQLKELDGPVTLLSVINTPLFTKLSNSPSDIKELEDLSYQLLGMFNNFDAIVLPLGSPAFMAILMKGIGIVQTLGDQYKLLFAHTERVSDDVVQPDGSIKKTSIFKHVKFIEVV